MKKGEKERRKKKGKKREKGRKSKKKEEKGRKRKKKKEKERKRKKKKKKEKEGKKEYTPIFVLSQTEIHTLNYISWKLIRKQASKQTSAKRIYRFPYPCIKVDAKMPFSNLAK